MGTLDFIFSETGSYWMALSREVTSFKYISQGRFVVQSRLSREVGGCGNKLGVHSSSPNGTYVLAVALKESSKWSPITA